MWLLIFVVAVVNLPVMSDSLRPHRLTHQAPLSMRFSRQEYWSGLPFPTPGLSCMSRSYILEINPLSVELFASVFSQFVGCLFILFMVSFAVQKLLSLIRSHLFIFVFIFITLGDRTKKNIAMIYVKECSVCVFP